MKHLVWLLIAGGMTFGASNALAQKSAGKDVMGADAMRHDSMNKDSMGKDAVRQDAMAAEPVENRFILRRSIREAGMDKE